MCSLYIQTLSKLSKSIRIIPTVESNYKQVAAHFTENILRSGCFSGHTFSDN